MDTFARSLLKRYGVATLAVLAAMLLKLLLAPLIERESPFILFFAAVTVAAWYGGLKPGLLATAMAVLIIDYFFLEPVYSLDFGLGSGQTLRLLLFLGEGTVISWLAGSLRRAEQHGETYLRELSESETRSRRLLETAHEGIWVLDREARTLYANQRLAEMLGYPLNELIGRSAAEFVAEEDLPAARRLWERRREGLREQFDFRFRRKDGSTLWTLVVTNPIFDEEGEFHGALRMLSDITSRVQAEEALRRAKGELEATVAARTAELRRAVAQLQAELVQRRRAEEALQKYAAEVEDLYNRAPCGYHSLDGDGRVVRVNDTELAWLGYAREEVLGKRFTDLSSPDSVRTFQEEFPRFKERGWVRDLEVQMRRKDGTLLPVLLNATAVKDAAGNFLMTRTTIVDITERQRAEKALEEAMEAAKSANRAKSEFLANVSHEVRTPLNIILGMTDLVLQTPLADQQADYLRMVQASGQSLLDLIEGLLDLAKIEAGKLRLDAVPFHLCDCLRKAVKPLGMRAHQKGLELVCSVSPAVPEDLIGDPGRLGQVVTNLVGNAIKFTERGEVCVRVDVAGVEEGPATDHAPATGAEVELHFAVADTGVGIPAEKFASIFEPFEQADSSVTRKYGGTGLGLSIAVQLAGLMGGRVWVESEVGRGSTFHFVVRLEVGQSSTTVFAEARLTGLRGLPVLLAGGSASSHRGLAETLRGWGLQSLEVDRAEPVLALLRRAAATEQPFAFVVLDSHLPDADAFALAEQIRREPGLAGTKVLMLSSVDEPGQAVRRGGDTGVAAWLMKPVLPSELRDALLAALHREPAEATERAGEGRRLLERPSRQLRILVVEDNLINQILMRNLLEKLGHTIVAVGSGPEALAALERQPFDVMLVDIQMPAMSGLELTTRVRERERATGAHLPIIAVTAHAMSADRDRCLAAGMDHYLTKPIHGRSLAEALGRLTTSFS